MSERKPSPFPILLNNDVCSLIQASEDVVVRMARPKDDFDEKGKPKKYTKKELAELRGTDKKLPGYKAEFGDISTDQPYLFRLTSAVTRASSLSASASGRKSFFAVSGQRFNSRLCLTSSAFFSMLSGVPW